MDIKTNNEIEANDSLQQPLSTPHFDAAMISQAQQVEPLQVHDLNRRPPSKGSFFGGRMAIVGGILVALLLGAVAVGMVLGLRDRQTAVEQPATATQATPAPTDTDEATPVVKAPVVAPTPAKVTRAQRAEPREPEPKIVSPERVRRTVQVGIDDIDQALSPKGKKPTARKVGELFGDDRRNRKGKSKHRDEDDHD